MSKAKDINYGGTTLARSPRNPEEYYEITKNFPELKHYLGWSDETQETYQALCPVLSNWIKETSIRKRVDMCDVGCSDGELTIPVAIYIRERVNQFALTGIEPDRTPYEHFVERIKQMGWYFAKAKHSTFQSFLTDNHTMKSRFDYIQFAQVFYHFPQEHWEMVLDGALRLLREKGLIAIIIDSHNSPAYELLDRVTNGVADFLDYGDLHSAEDVEELLVQRGLSYESTDFPIRLKVDDDERKLQEFARMLGFLYRTTPDKVFSNHKDEMEQLLETSCRNGRFEVENRIKIFSIAP